MSRTRTDRRPYPTSLDAIDDEDRAILECIKNGQTYRQAGRVLGINHRTIADRVQAIVRLFPPGEADITLARRMASNRISTSADALSPRDQQIIDFWQEGRETKEIARITNLLPNSVASRIGRLRENLGTDLVPLRNILRDTTNLERGPAKPTKTSQRQPDRAGRVRCLGGCNQHFDSPDRCRVRICPVCKARRRNDTGGLAEHRIFPS